MLTRRTRISIETAHRGVETAARVAELMRRELGWAEERTTREVAHYTARVEAERESQRMPDDRTADAARLGAADVRAGVMSPRGGEPASSEDRRVVTGGRSAGPAR